MKTNGLDFDKKWKEEADAHTLAEAEKIKADKKRLKGASRGAQRMLKEENVKVKALRKVAKGK